jgi:hypothetical protein
VDDQVERDGLASFCADLGRLRAMLRGPAAAAARAEIEQVVRAARRGEPVAEQVSALLTETGVPDGAYGAPPRDVLPPRVADVALPPVTGSYVCPVDVCNRVEARRAGSPVPSCEVHQQALRFHTDGATW